MKYLLLIFENEKETEQFPREKMQGVLSGYGTFTRQVIERGILESSTALLPTSDATTVKVREGRVQATKGPFAETKDQICGYYLLNCENLDDAIAQAAQIPSAAYGAIEIRAVRTF